MKRVTVRRADPVIARSLKVTRTTFSMVATFTAGVAANVMLSAQVLSALGQVAVFALMFAVISIISASLVADIFTRSNQVVTTLRTLGATKGAISKSIVVSLFVPGAAGAAIGAALGGGLGAAGLVQGALGTGLGSIMLNGVVVLAMSLAAIGCGVYAGVRTAWRN